MTPGDTVDTENDVCRTGWYGPGAHIHTCCLPWPHDGTHPCECGATLTATEPEDTE